MLQVGATLQGRYAIERVLGQGGMGAVYLARQTLLGDKKVAIKETILPTQSDEERQQAMAQFQVEAQTLARLDHPNIAGVLDFLQENDSYFLIMEYIKGSTLEDVMHNSETPLEVKQVVDWTIEIADVLHYLHNQDPPVIFRDLKPSNIMLDDHGRLRLIDFGIAKTVDVDNKTKTVIKGAGTPGFSPLEQFAGNTDARSDIYALGATAYNLLTGHIPPPSLGIAAREEDLIAPDQLNPKVSPALSGVVLKMMALFKEQRYESATEVKQALQLALAGQQSDAQARRLAVAEKAKANMPGYQHVALKTVRPRSTGAPSAPKSAPPGRRMQRFDDEPVPLPRGLTGNDGEGPRGVAPPPPTTNADNGKALSDYAAPAEGDSTPDRNMWAANLPPPRTGAKPSWVSQVENVPNAQELATIQETTGHAVSVHTLKQREKTMRRLYAGILVLTALPYVLMGEPSGPIHWINILLYRAGHLVGSDLGDLLQSLKVIDVELATSLAVFFGALAQVMAPSTLASFMFRSRNNFWGFACMLWMAVTIAEIGSCVNTKTMTGESAHDWKVLISGFGLEQNSSLLAMMLHMLGLLGVLVSMLLLARNLTADPLTNEDIG